MYIVWVFGLNGFIDLVNCVWCIDSRLVYMVVVIDVSIDFVSVRVKLERFDVVVSRFGGKLDSVMVVSGIKK